MSTDCLSTVLCILASLPAWALDLGVATAMGSTVTVVGGFRYAVQDKTADKRSLYILNTGTGEKREIYHSLGAIWDFEMSPDGTYIAGSERTSESPEKSLFVITTEGELVLKVTGVYRFSWAPDGGSIAYIVGNYTEDGLGFIPSGVWIYELKQSVARKLPCLGQDLSWAEHDKNLYIWFIERRKPDRVIEYRPDTQQLLETTHEGVDFSPDGKYYYAPQYEGGPFRLFLSATDEEITDRVRCVSIDVAFGPSGWLTNSILVVPVRIYGANRDTLVNVETDTFCELPGEVITYPIGGTTFKMWSNGAIADVALDSLKFEGAKE